MHTILVAEQSLEMPKFIEMRNLVSSYVPNVPDFTCANAIREASRQYFRSTHSYVLEIDTLLEANERNGFIDILGCPYDVEFVAMLGARLGDNKHIDVVTHLPTVQLLSRPNKLKVISRKEFYVHPTPKTDEEIILSVAVRPSFNADELDDNVYMENEEELRIGAIAILKSQVNTEWYSPEEVSYYKAEFNQMISQKKVDIQQSYSDANVGTNIPNYL